MHFSALALLAHACFVSQKKPPAGGKVKHYNRRQLCTRSSRLETLFTPGQGREAVVQRRRTHRLPRGERGMAGVRDAPKT
jgi:hypothetical protein